MRPELLTLHLYTVVGQAPDGGFLLQAEVTGPVPDATPVVHWPGVPGFTCKATPGTRVVVAFVGRVPVVLGFDSTPALEGTWDYLELKLGGELAKPVANADAVDALLDLMGKVNAAAGSAPYPGFAADAGKIKALLAAMRTRAA
jgi:hypothetical protein